LEKRKIMWLTNKQPKGVTMLLLELLIAVKNPCHVNNHLSNSKANIEQLSDIKMYCTNDEF
jgi:hypothetical protein